VYGAMLILCMMFLPGGLAEGLDRLTRAGRALWAGRRATPSEGLR